MEVIDLSQADVRTLNRRLQAARAGTFQVLHPGGEHALAAGLAIEGQLHLGRVGARSRVRVRARRLGPCLLFGHAQPRQPTSQSECGSWPWQRGYCTLRGLQHRGQAIQWRQRWSGRLGYEDAPSLCRLDVRSVTLTLTLTLVPGL